MMPRWAIAATFAFLMVALATPMFAMPVGICQPLGRIPLSQLEPTLGRIASLGATVVRWDAPWAQVETRPGQFTLPPQWDQIVESTSRHGIRTLLILHNGPVSFHGGKPLSLAEDASFARYAAFIAGHFRNKPVMFEIWNEWDGRVGGAIPGDAPSYAQLVRVVSAAIRKVNPQAIILAGSTSGTGIDSYRPNRVLAVTPAQKFLKSLLDLGLLDYVDGLAVHPYVVYERGTYRTGHGFAQLIDNISADVRGRSNGRSKPLYVTEIGWPTGIIKAPFTPSEQADYLVGAIRYSASHGIKMLNIYQLQDAGSNPADPEANYGLWDNAGRPKPAVGPVEMAIRSVK